MNNKFPTDDLFHNPRGHPKTPIPCSGHFESTDQWRGQVSIESRSSEQALEFRQSRTCLSDLKPSEDLSRLIEGIFPLRFALRRYKTCRVHAPKCSSSEIFKNFVLNDTCLFYRKLNAQALFKLICVAKKETKF